MKKLLVALGLIVLVGGGYVAVTSSSGPATLPTEELKQPWVEVLSPRLTLVNSSSTAEIRELKTGDEVAAGSTLKVDASGLANLYLPNGSVVRLDHDTVLTITEADYNPKTESIAVRLSLSVGKIWNKVVSLATPDSHWEVETANTVVTVRGTAFGVSADKKGKSTVVGSEGKVAAKKKNQTNEVLVVADTFLAVEKSATTTENLLVKKVTDEITHDAWVTNNKGEDKKLEARIEAIRAERKDDAAVREQFRTQIQDQFRDQIERRRKEAPVETRPTEETKTDTKPTEIEVKTDVKVDTRLPLVPKVPVTTKTEVTVPVKTPIAGNPVIVGVQVGRLSKDVLKEGETLAAHAILGFRDAASKEVSTDIEWKVVGPIGSITPAGVFTAKLGADVSETGVGKGFIVVTWKDPKTGEAFLGKSPVITVNSAEDGSSDQAI